MLRPSSAFLSVHFFQILLVVSLISYIPNARGVLYSPPRNFLLMLLFYVIFGLFCIYLNLFQPYSIVIFTHNQRFVNISVSYSTNFDIFYKHAVKLWGFVIYYFSFVARMLQFVQAYCSLPPLIADLVQATVMSCKHDNNYE